MRSVLGFILMFLACSAASGQQSRFVFIQDSKKQPFYVRLGDNSYSSSAAGHLTLPLLKDSSYDFHIGFPGNSAPEQVFTIPVRGKDRGFELRRAWTGWILADIVTQASIEAVGIEQRVMQGEKKSDPYSVLMSRLVNDSAVLYTMPAADSATEKAAAQKPAAKGKPKQDNAAQRQPANNAQRRDTAAREPQAATPEVQADTPRRTAPRQGVANVADTIRDNPSRSPDSAAMAAPADVPAQNFDSRDIIRHQVENIAEGRMMIYLDRSALVTDTIRLVIPRR